MREKSNVLPRGAHGVLKPCSLSILLIAALMCSGCGNDDQIEPETATSAQALNSCVTVPSDLLAWWGGDGSGAQLAGSYPMIYDGADYLPGKVTQAFDFDGVNYGTLGPVANRIDLAPKPGFTLAAWIKKGATSTQSIMDERAAERHFEWRVLSSGLLEYSVSPSSLVSTVSIADNQWHFVVLTHDKVTQVAKIYVDGALNATGNGKRYSDTGNGLLTSVNGFAVTRRSGAGLDMDEPMIFGRALSATEISSLYNAGDGGACKPTGYPVCGNSTVESSTTYGNAEECDDGNLASGDGCSTVCKTEHAVADHVISWWKFSEGSGLFADDYVDGNDGALTSTSVWGTGAPNLGGGIGPSTSTSQSARVDVPDRPNQHLGKNPFTITLWVNARTNISLSHRWFEKLNLHGTVSARSPDGYQCCGDIKVGIGGATNDIFFQAGRVNDHDVHATAPIVGAGWKHIAAVRETNGTLRIYVDCVLKASRLNTAAIEPILNVTNRGGIILGSGQSSQLDEVMIFDKAMTVSEICDIKGGNYPPDACPNDPNKVVPGICGCGVPDTDTDGDGAADCNETCDTDPAKTSPGVCGCGVSDADSDADGTADCNDACPSDAQNDADGDGVCGNVDYCPGTNLLGPIPTVVLRPNHIGDNTTVNGCNCSQILACKNGNDNGEIKFGCTTGIIVNVWQNLRSWAHDDNNNGRPDCTE